MEDKDKRKGWLKELKEGDKIIVNSNYRVFITVVDKITPTGRIKVGNTQYDYTGWEITSDSWHRNSLEQWSQKKEDRIKRQIEFKKMCNKLSNTKWEDCSYEFVEKCSYC